MRILRDRSWMLFVDGENFAKAGQRSLQAAGIKPAPGPYWRKDVYLWARDGDAHWRAIEPHRSSGSSIMFHSVPAADLRRAYYYTTDTAAGAEWTETRLALRALGFEPRLFQRRQGRSKAVDVALASEMLALGAAGQYEAAVVVAGDGDYVPLLEAVKRLGLHVGVAFLAADTSPELRIAADEYIDLTEHLVQSWQPEGKADE